MVHLKNFTKYKPIETPSPQIQFVKSQEGVDWYEAQKDFQEDTFGVVYDSEGHILSFNKDKSMLFPHEGCSVIELEVEPTYEGVILEGTYYEEDPRVTEEESEAITIDELNLLEVLAGQDEYMTQLETELNDLKESIKK